MHFKRTFTDDVPESVENAFEKAGIATFHGHARFVDATKVQVGEDILSARHVMIATGAKPADLDIPGQELLMLSEEFMDLDELPRKIIFAGGGYISFEFAHLAARAGAKVTILHRDDHPLRGFDPDLVGQLVETTRDVGIDLRLDARVYAIEKSNGGVLVRATTERGEELFEADIAVHGAGRVPDLGDLNLEKAGVEREPHGVKVNEYLQSVSNPAVYAAGDAAALGLPLTPVAYTQGDIAAENLLHGNRTRFDASVIPTVVFTVPPLAAVGLSEAAARDRGLKFQVHQADTSTWYASRRLGMKHTGFKVLVSEEDQRILGAHLLGPNAEEVINVFALAMRFGIPAPELKRMLYAYPTDSHDVRYML
jgi:glutathione reductase (NADPH)